MLTVLLFAALATIVLADIAAVGNVFVRAAESVLLGCMLTALAGAAAFAFIA